MKTRCVIVTAYIPGGVGGLYAPNAGDFIICADGGYVLCKEAGIAPDAFIGDFDSMEEQALDCLDSIRVPVEKDDTDTLLCVKHGLDLGYREFLILGGIGGRLDHTIANLQTLHFAHDRGARAQIMDRDNEAFLISPGSVTLSRKAGYKLSLFAWTQICTGVTERGVQYPLTDATLIQSFPLGVSNVIEEPTAIIQLDSGLLLCVLSRE